MYRKLFTIVCVVFMTAAAWADWNPGDPYKWLQRPDLEPTGMDVYATWPKVLADDFLCIEVGPITSIHIWGSWYQDILPMSATGAPDPHAVLFHMGIWSDIPDPDPASPNTWSMPGQLLWEKRFTPGDFIARPYATGLREGWYNPNTGFYTPDGDTVAWQYNFHIGPDEAFIQEGTPDNPVVYWLSLHAVPNTLPGTPEALFGWKTSLDNWNDDAVFADPALVPPVPWTEMRYPSAHPFGGHTIDLAFVIVPEPLTMTLLGLGALALIRRR